MQQAFQAEKAAGVNVVFQFHITGDGGGDWFAEVKDGACRIEAGKRDAPTTTITMAAGDFPRHDGRQAFGDAGLHLGPRSRSAAIFSNRS